MSAEQQAAEKPQNPSAFPMMSPDCGPVYGMTLLDYVAASVLQGLMANPSRYDEITNQIRADKLTQEGATAKNVNKAFLIADAFLAERAKRGLA